jgi:glycosyltransferase involved in cell wall biosynthesis
MPSGADIKTCFKPGLAYIVSRFPDYTETFIAREMVEFCRRGWDLTIFSLQKICNQKIIQPEAKRLFPRVTYTPFLFSSTLLQAIWHFLRHRRQVLLKVLILLAFQNKTRLDLYLKTWVFLPKAVLLAYLMQRGGVQHIHAHWAHHPTTVALIIHLLTGIRYSFTTHAHDLYVNKILLPLKIEQASFVITIARYNINILRNYNNGCKDKIHLIYNAIDLEDYRAKKRPLLQPPLILAIGRLIPMKGFDFLIRACIRLKQAGIAFQCMIVGDGPEMNRLNKMITKATIEENVRCIGPQGQAVIKDLLQQASLFVVPSIISRDGSHDGLPTVLIESLAMGVPSIASRVAGIPEIIDHYKTGILVPPARADDLFLAMQEMLSDSSLCHKVARQGRKKVEEFFSLEKNIGRLEWIFEKAMQLRQSPNP